MQALASAVLVTALLCGTQAARCRAEAPQVARVSILVGSRLPDEGEQEQPGASPLKSPFGVDFSRDGAMFIAELEGGRIHRRDADGTLQVFAGDGSKRYTGDEGPAGAATFNGMHNLAISRAGTLYVADTWNHCVREIDLVSGRIATFAGTGEAGFAGDGGPAKNAQFHDVMCVSLNPQEDTLFIADLKNYRIRAIDLSSRVVRTVAGNGRKGVPRDGDAAVDAPLVDPRAVAADGEGRIYVLERGGHALRVVETDGRIRTVAGTGKPGFQDGPGREAQFGAPKHLCVDPAGRVYIADDQNAAVRCFDPAADRVTTVLGREHGDPQLTLKHPHGVCIENGSLYVVDTGHDRILRVEFIP